ncbi:MAG: EAL domain-containing protein, partial [Actinomycetia bacterium]|nr:EAL domain-containing protein [Actinomycetes bacterium]
TLTQEPERAGRAIERLADMGVKVSIDDFGTGYSSLRYLQSLPISALKIDETFVREAHQRPESAAVADAVISIARCFDLEVIAEGVETQEELSMMRSLGCNRVQGYLIARPLRPEDVMAFIDSYDKTLSFARVEVRD